jgi:hypothetical protein
MRIGVVFHYGDGPGGGDQIPRSIEVVQISDFAAANDQAENSYFSRAIIPRVTRRPIRFGPRQEGTIALSLYADEIHAKVESSKHFSEVTKCLFIVDKVYFDDQAMIWGYGGYGYAVPADPNSPKRYRRLAADYFPGDPSQTTGAR